MLSKLITVNTRFYLVVMSSKSTGFLCPIIQGTHTNNTRIYLSKSCATSIHFKPFHSLQDSNIRHVIGISKEKRLFLSRFSTYKSTQH